MRCTKCKTVNNFKRDGKAVYCGVCFYTLGYIEKKRFNKNRRRKYQREYQKKYYYNKRKRHLPGITLREIAIIKMCSRRVVYKHKNKFDLIEGTKPMRFEFNKKVLDWYPK